MLTIIYNAKINVNCRFLIDDIKLRNFILFIFCMACSVVPNLILNLYNLPSFFLMWLNIYRFHWVSQEISFNFTDSHSVLFCFQSVDLYSLFSSVHSLRLVQHFMTILCFPPLLLPSVFASIRVFSFLSFFLFIYLFIFLLFRIVYYRDTKVNPSFNSIMNNRIRVFSNESVLHIRGPKCWSFSFNISPPNEYSGLISLRIDWFDLFAVQGTVKSLLQYHSSKVSILQCSQLPLWSNSHIHTWVLEKT